MPKGNKFNFVKKDEQNFLEDDKKEESLDLELDPEEIKKKKRKAFIKKVVTGSIIMLVITALLVGFALFWANDTSLIAITDAFWFAFIIEFAVAWIMFVYNLNIFASFIYGTKTLGRMILGKQIKSDYYTYMKTVEENPIPKFFYWLVFISSFIVLLVAVILLMIVI